MSRSAMKAIGFALLISLTAVLLVIGENPEESFFSKSLHHTGEGMRYWYEQQGGFMDVTKIPYEKLDCQNCHVKTCDACHTQKIGDTCLFSVNKAYDMETCLPCHSREGLTFRMGKEKGNLDVHVEKGMVCANCHEGEDVHGSGTFHKSMRDVQAVKVSCTTCHAVVDMEVSAHEVHEGKLDCSACHVDNTTACMNCHFDTFLETGSRKGNFFPMQSWTLLINYNGKVTSGTAMSLVYKDKKFILYTPYFTHAVKAKGKGCTECHANSAMKLIEEGKPVPMMAFKDSKVVNWKGVAPVVPEKLEWVYLNKVGDKWIPIESNEAAKIQFVGYGTSLTKEQIESLTTPYEE